MNNMRDRSELHICAENGAWWVPGKPAIPAEWLRDLVVTGKIPGTDTGVHTKGLRIRGVVLDGPLDLEHASLAVPLILDDVEASEPIVLEQATGRWISITNSQLSGISAHQLTLNHSLDLSGSKSTEPINLGGARITGDVHLSNGFTADGEVALTGAAIGGNLYCHGGSFNNMGKDALDADGAQIVGNVFLNDGFTANGEVRLLGATVGGDLQCDGGSFNNKGRDALSVDRSQITGDVFLINGFSADGVVRLVGTTIGGQLSCHRGRFSNPDSFGLRLQEATVAGAFIWRPKSPEARTKVDVRTCSVGPLVDDIESWPKEKRLDLSGFTYSRFSGGATWNVEDRISWLRGMDGFHSQPYEHLAAVYRAVGRTVEARKVCIDREWARTETLGNDRGYEHFDKVRRGWLRFWHRMWGWTTSFGFEPARALWILAGVLLAAALFFWWAGESGVMEPTDRSETVSATECTEEYPCYRPFVYAADVMIPIVNLGQRDTWTVDSARGGSDADPLPLAVGGALVNWVTVFLIVAGWVLTAAFIAAVSRTISRS